MRGEEGRSRGRVSIDIDIDIDIDIAMAGSHCCMAETTWYCKAIFLQLKNKFRKRLNKSHDSLQISWLPGNQHVQ